MNIVHVLPHLGRGGAERLTIELANGQVEAGHQVTMVIGYRLPEAQLHDPPDGRVGIRYVAGQRPGRIGKYWKMLGWLRRNRDFIARQDVLHCHLTFGALFASAVRRMPGKRPAIVETYHAVGMPIPRLQRWFHERLASQWDGFSIMVDNPYWSAFLTSHPRIASRVIPAGVSRPDVESVSAAERAQYLQELGIPDDAAPIVTTVGRLYEERQPRRYIPVFATIARALGGSVNFIMGGDGPERDAIVRDAQSAGIAAQLHLPGTIRRMELPLVVSDLYVTVNVGPVCGVAGLQAVAAGVPVIALQLSSEYQRRPSDWIWSGHDPDEVGAEAMRLLRSPKALQDLARRQRDYLEANHSPAAMVREFDALYRDAIQARR